MATFLERYQQGEYEAVWDELIRLGDEVFSEPLYTDAYAVACETMTRVRRNIELLIPRLQSCGYVFGYSWALERGTLDAKGVREFEESYPVLWPMSSDMGQKIDLVEQMAGALPLSLRAFYEIIGGVNFVGWHPEWRDKFDPLEVISPQTFLELDESIKWSEDKHTDGTWELPIAPDSFFKYLYSGGGPYAIRVPARCADAPLLYEPHKTTFVNYLRICMQWGGFADWQYLQQKPYIILPSQAVLDALRDGLEPM